MNNFLCFSGCALLLLLSLVGCNSSDKALPYQTLRLNMVSEPPTLDPRINTDLVSLNIIKHLFEGLVRETKNGIEPAIAESFTLSEDGKTYHFKLREAYWSNGRPVTAHDFISAWQWVIAPQNPSGMARLQYVIENAQEIKKGVKPLTDFGAYALNDRELIIKLAKPAPHFLSLLTLPIYFPVYRQADDEAINWAFEAATFISNGPFNLKTWRHSDQIVLVKNPHYWNNEAVQLEQIHFNMIEDAGTELQMYESGALDWCGNPLTIGIPKDALPTLQSSGKLHSDHWNAPIFYMFNTLKHPFNNSNLRKAFTYAINRKDVVEHILQGKGQEALSLVPTGLIAEASYFKDHDLPAARKHFQTALEELKITKEQLPPITLIYNSAELHQSVAQAVQEQIRKAFGISLQLQHMEWKAYLSEVDKRDFCIARLGMQPPYDDPLAFIEIFSDRTNFLNVASWENPEYIALYEQSFFQKDKERLETLQKAEAILMDEMPFCPLFFYKLTYLRNEKLQNVFISPTGMVDFTWAYFDE